MMQINPKFTQLRKTRTVIDVFRDAQKYLSLYGKSIFPVLLTSGAALIIISQIIMFIIGGANSFYQVISMRFFLAKNLYLTLLLAFAGFVTGLMLFTLILNRHLTMFDKSQSELDLSGLKLKTELGLEFRNHFVSLIILFVLFYAAVLFGDYIGIQLRGVQTMGWDYDLNPFERFYNYFIQNIPNILIVPLVFYLTITGSFVSYRDNIGALEAVKKVWDTTIRNSRKAGIVIIIIFLLNFGAVKSIEYVFLAIFNVLSVISSYDFFSLSYVMRFFILLAQLFVFCYAYIVLIMLYGSLEDESEGYYIKRKIEEL